MKISDILGFLQVSYSLRGDIDYSPEVDLSQLDLTGDKLPSNKRFHEAAKELETYLLTEEINNTRRNSYPQIGDQLEALVKQVQLLSTEGYVPEFAKILSDIQAVKEANPK